jgi:hypothetical protein
VEEGSLEKFMTSEPLQLAFNHDALVKKCSKCGIKKNLECFQKRLGIKGELKSQCKQCVAEWGYIYRSTNASKIRERCKIHRLNASQIEEKKLKRQKQSKLSNQISRIKYPDRERSRRAVEYAVKVGKLIKPNNCSQCGTSCKPEAHHDSYDYDQRLNVRWLCRKCHAAHHRKYPDTV